MRQITIVFILLLTAFSQAQETGSVSGKLIDKEYNNEPLPFANVLIKGTTTGVTSDIDGLYKIENLDPGTYTFQFSFVGYETIENQVEVIAGQDTKLDVIMFASAAALDEVVIKTTAKRETETALLLDQKKATTIKQSIGAQELSRKGISDAAGAVTKISGISKQEGGGNVYVRGLGDRYLNTTYNGLTLPSNDIEKKNMDLNLFSSDIIQNVGVSKTYAANFYGDFAAGNVDIVAKEHTGDFFLDVNLGSNFNSNAIGKNFVKSEGTGYFGFYNRYRNNPYAVILSHGVDPQSIDGSLGVEGSITGGKSWEVGEESRLSLFTT